MKQIHKTSIAFWKMQMKNSKTQNVSAQKRIMLIITFGIENWRKSVWIMDDIIIDDIPGFCHNQEIPPFITNRQKGGELSNY